MSKKGRTNKRQSDFGVVARGVRRVPADHSRLMRGGLDYYQASNEKAAESSHKRRRKTEADDGRR